MELGALCSGYNHIPSRNLLLTFVVQRISTIATLSISEKVESVTTTAAVVIAY